MTVCCNWDVKTAIRQENAPVSVPSPTTSVELLKQDLIVRHNEADRLWAARTNLKPEQIRNLRLMSEVFDDEEEYIDNLDTRNLKKLNHVLLVTASGNGHCLKLIVFERHEEAFRYIWSTDETASGAGFCRESPRNPEAFATTDGRIVVRIPVFDYNKNTAKSTDIHTYVWTGKTYEQLG